MTLHVKDVQPLWRLVEETGLAGTIESCHIREPGEKVGGYCQGLFPVLGSPGEHTKYLAKMLAVAGARYPNSHELCLDTKPSSESVERWLTEATEPFRNGNGCVPVLITNLGVGESMIGRIFASPRQFDEPVLVRMLITEDSESFFCAAYRMERLVEQVRSEKIVPAWWPLFQGNMSVNGWKQLRQDLGEYWKYVCVAMNPFMGPGVQNLLFANIVVAQVPIGLADGIESNKIIINGTSYSLDEYCAHINALPHRPVFIVLGQSLPEWSEDMNVSRVSRAIEVLKEHQINL